MKPAITDLTTDGLRPEHAAAAPLLDRVDVPSRGPQQVRRTYADGAQYLLTADGTAPAWVTFPAITDAGVAALRRILADELVDVPAPPPGPASGGGRLVWVAYGAGGARVVTTPSGSYGNLPAFVQHLDEAVSQNVRRAP